MAVMAICALFLCSCAKPEPALLAEVTVQYTEVPAAKGSMFVKVKCSGLWTLHLKEGDAPADWAELSKTTGMGDASAVRLTYDENTTGQNRQLTLAVSSGNQWSTQIITQLAAGSEPGTGNGPDSGNHGSGDGNQDDGNQDDGNQDDGNQDSGDDGQDGGDQNQDGSTDTGLAATGWMELPNVDDPNLEYYTHRFTYPNDKKQYRNYTFGWSQKDLVAVWVAYPLCSFYTNKTVDRTNAWAYDPLLGSSRSSAPFGGYGGNYARGHQLPSADRLCCVDANKQTFYGSNLTPQQNEHNEGIWQALEDKVRTIANKSDTTYVVTGCMVKNPRGTTTDSDGKSMTVPSHYFKALLRYTKASTQGQWSAAAFYLEHKNYSKSSSGYDFKAVSMSIDELEEITGLDFFVNLPDMVGDDMAARLEAQDPVNSTVWW